MTDTTALIEQLRSLEREVTRADCQWPELALAIARIEQLDRVARGLAEYVQQVFVPPPSQLTSRKPAGLARRSGLPETPPLEALPVVRNAFPHVNISKRNLKLAPDRMTADMVCAEFGHSKTWLYNVLAKGFPAAVEKIGCIVLWDRAAVMAFKAAQSTKPRARAFPSVNTNPSQPHANH